MNILLDLFGFESVYVRTLIEGGKADDSEYASR